MLHKVYQVPFEPGFQEDVVIRLELEGNKLQLLLKVSEVLATLCEGILNNTEILKELKDFDLIVHDSVAFCGAFTLVNAWIFQEWRFCQFHQIFRLL